MTAEFGVLTVAVAWRREAEIVDAVSKARHAVVAAHRVISLLEGCHDEHAGIEAACLAVGIARERIRAAYDRLRHGRVA